MKKLITHTKIGTHKTIRGKTYIWDGGAFLYEPKDLPDIKTLFKSWRSQKSISRMASILTTHTG